MHRAVRKFSISLGVFVASLAIAEVSLQIAAFFVSRSVQSRAHASGLPSGSRPLVAFCGDSNIYGLYLEHPETETLPKQIEHLSRNTGNQQSAAPTIRTINLGVPASPSWAVLRQVATALQFKPAAVVVRVGLNNAWQIPPGSAGSIWDHFRLVRLVRLVLSRREEIAHSTHLGAGGAETDPIEFITGANTTEMRANGRDGIAEPFEIRRYNNERIPFESAVPRLREDLIQMVALCKARGVPILFATYLECDNATFARIRKLMLDLQRELDIPVADCGAWLQPAVLGSPPTNVRELQVARRSTLLTRDYHPTAAGYRIEARVLAAELAKLHILPEAGIELPLAAMHREEISIPKLRRAAGRQGIIEVFTKPGDRVSILVGFAQPSVYRELSIPIDILTIKQQQNIRQPILAEAVADPGGKVEFRLPPAVARGIPGARLLAWVERGGKFGAATAFISNSLALE